MSTPHVPAARRACPPLSLPLAVVLALAALPATACDLCAIYACLEARETGRGLYTGFSEQYSDFSTLRHDGDEVPNPAGQYLRSAISQAVVGYQFSRRFGVQANVPYVARDFRRAEEGAAIEDRERGLGDAVVLAHWRAFESYDADRTVIWNLVGGVKLPTGSSDRLAEEAGEGHQEEPDEHSAAATTSGVRGVASPHEGHAHGPASGVHGHDVALGSGSLDGVLGTTGQLGWKRLFVQFSGQYALRREGDHGYRYGDDLNWSVTPGFFAWLGHERSLSLGLNVAGEEKHRDELDGEPADDTAISALYAGPAIAYSRGGRFFAKLELDLPLRQQTTELQIVPDSRVRLGLTARF
jgi:hypothetical protein